MIDAPMSKGMLRYTHDLQQAASLSDVLRATRAQLAASLGYQHAWLLVAERGEVEELSLAAMSGPLRARMVEHAKGLRLHSKLLEPFEPGVPVVVSDARGAAGADLELFSPLVPRTLIHVPVPVWGQPPMALGTGTFGEEGSHPPSARQLEGLRVMVAQLALALSRLRLVEDAERSEAALRRREAQLRQTQKTDAMGRLAIGLAHDFNNVLSVIMGYGTLVSEQIVAGTGSHEDLQEIMEASRRGASLTAQLLALSRQREPTPVASDLGALVVRMSGLFERLLGANIELVARIGAALWNALVDVPQMEHVLLNLVLNARDAMPAGGKLVIEVDNQVHDPQHQPSAVGLSPGPYVRLSLTDTGQGMDPETQAQIFEPFFTTKSEGKGTGLGLTMARGIVEQCGGKIRVSSKPGAGSTFELYFPRYQGGVEASLPVSGEGSPSGSETVLLAEDHPQLRKAICRSLEGYGYAILSAGSAAEALRVAEQYEGPIHLLLTDVVMPRMSGKELAQRLAAARKLRVLYMSGYTNDSVADLGVDACSARFVQKPFTPLRLARAVRRSLDEVDAPNDACAG